MMLRRETQKGSNKWWHLHWPRDEAIWESDKIISIQMAARPSAVPSFRPVYVSFSTNVFVPNEGTQEHLLYLAALMNSRALWVWYQHRAKRRGVGLEINGNVLSRTPIRRIDFDNPDEVRRHDEVVAAADRLIQLNAELRRAATAPDAEPIVRQIETTEQVIDDLVFALYDLDESEQAAILAATVTEAPSQPADVEEGRAWV